ncbi:MAG: hypothetical protein H5T61_15690 [Thermoflexales bacterium]|nr:hypothetical protein [Thermoflexales bacterium]
MFHTKVLHIVVVSDTHKCLDTLSPEARWGFPLLLIFPLITVLSLVGCSPVRSDRLTPAPTIILPLTQSPYSLSLTEISVDEAMQYFQDPASQEQLNGINAITQAGWKSIHTIARFGPTDQELTSGVSAALKPGEPFVGYLLIANIQEYGYDIGFVATLDYEPLRINYNEMPPQALPVVHFESGDTRAFKFSLSPLPEGLHALVITYVTDPYRVFILDPTRFDPETSVAIGVRTQPHEFGVLLFVTPAAPQTVTDWPARARAFLPDQTIRLDSAQLLKNPLPGRSSQFLAKDAVKAGETVTYYAKFLGPTDPGEWPDMPVRVLVFWDEMLSQADDLAVPVQATAQGQSIPYPIHVPTGLEAGEHILMVIAYPYPYYLRFWRSKDGSETWSANALFFGYLMARLPVTVVR